MNSKPIIAALAVILIGATFYRQHLATEREHQQAAAMKAELENARRQAEESARTKERNEALAAEATQLREKLADLKKTGGSEEASASKAASAKGPAGSGDFMKGLAKMFTDPKMKDAMKAQQAMGMRMMYGSVAEDLGLSPEQTSQLMDLLAERQVALSAKALRGLSGEAGASTLDEVAKDARKMQTDYDAQIATLLGEEKAREFKAYEATIGDRFAVQQYQQSMTSAGLALDDAQRKSLLQIMIEERKSAPKNAALSSGDIGAQMRTLQSDDGVEKVLASQRELNQRVLARAHTILSPDQMNAFEAAQKQQTQMMEMGLQMSKAMTGGAK